MDRNNIHCQFYADDGLVVARNWQELVKAIGII
jgi:hypothetical protein